MQVYIGLGSNLGEREQFLKEAVRRLSLISTSPIVESPIYESKALVEPGVEEKSAYLNQVVLIETELEPKSLLFVLKGFEKLMGRKSREHWGDREIDLDILLYGDQYISEDRLVIPHVGLNQRQFMLAPLVDICETIIHPTEKVAVKAMLDGLKHFEGDDLCQIWKSQS